MNAKPRANSTHNELRTLKHTDNKNRRGRQPPARPARSLSPSRTQHVCQTPEHQHHNPNSHTSHWLQPAAGQALPPRIELLIPIDQGAIASLSRIPHSSPTAGKMPPPSSVSMCEQAECAAVLQGRTRTWCRIPLWQCRAKTPTCATATAQVKNCSGSFQLHTLSSGTTMTGQCHAHGKDAPTFPRKRLPQAGGQPTSHIALATIAPDRAASTAAGVHLAPLPQSVFTARCMRSEIGLTDSRQRQVHTT